MKKLLVVLSLLAAPAALSDDGMWTFDNVPKERIKARYGFEPTDAWLTKAMRASARLAFGCSGSFVSPQGLVMTNHHCAQDCLEQLSTPQKDLLANGFYAKTAAEEVRCSTIEVNQLLETTDVTQQMAAVTQGLDGAKRHEAEVAFEARFTKDCQTSDALRCDLVSLYQGGEYRLYKYRRFQDVRLVFAPEYSIAAFGGDPDNFMFPRWNLDVAFMRVYDNGAPAKTEDYFRWSPRAAKDGDLVFVSGNPGRTDRLMTVAELELERDAITFDAVVSLSEYRGKLHEYQRRGAEQKRHSETELFITENTLKELKGREKALLDPTLITAKRAEETALRARIAASPALQQKYGGAWDAIGKALEKYRSIRVQARYAKGVSGELFRYARTLVVGTAELQKPNEQRYAEFSDSNLPERTQRLFSNTPVYPELEIFQISDDLGRMREELGPDDPFVKKVLGRESPDELADRVVKGSKLADPALRKRLWEGGAAAVRASDDPMIKLAQLIDPDARALKKIQDAEVEAVLDKSREQIARARFELDGRKNYPDATFTLRLSYGQVKGWREKGRDVPPVTTFAGAYDRATGREPFALPQSWIKAKGKLDLKTPFNFATTNDIVGGNSGSPMFNRDLQIVGIAFDGNIHSLGGDFGFDEALNRAVGVEGVAITESLSRIYGAVRLLKELGAGAPAM